jgi:hypothetical protein
VGHLASPLEYGPDVPNPLVSEAEWAEAVAGMGLLLVMVAMVGALVAIAQRFRRGSHNERQRLKWVVFGAPLGVLLVIPGNSGATGRIAEIAANVGVAIVFASITAAVLRYRLYDIDLIINRTLVYGALTVTLASAYFAAVVVFSQATRSFTPDSDIAIALSTLIVAGLFGPLRTRLQAAIDRRFYRSRYDALRAAEGFSVALRNTVDIRSIEELFVDVVEETLQPEHSALWIEERA